jgi:hypothetical protein
MASDGRDPSGFVTSTPSVVVKVVDTARNDINGLLGIVISYNVERERYLVHMTRSQSTMAFKKENLAKANMMESYRSQWQQLQNDPRVREKMGQYMRQCQQLVAPAQLTHVIFGIVAVLALLMYLVGFTKLLMLLSTLILLLVIAGPDIMNKKPPKFILNNFPNRAREVMEDNVPMLKGRISNRMAMGVMLLMVALCLQSLFLGGGKKRAQASVQPPASSHVMSPSFAAQKYYNLGFEDATAGLKHGTSLPEPEDEMPLAQQGEREPHYRDLGQDGDYYSPPSPPLKKNDNSFLSNAMSITNAMSIFYLYRTIMELGTEPSTGLFATGQLLPNIQHAELWRKALLALSVYKVLRIFV